MVAILMADPIFLRPALCSVTIPSNVLDTWYDLTTLFALLELSWLSFILFLTGLVLLRYPVCSILDVSKSF
jgi:hypothetical protein